MTALAEKGQARDLEADLVICEAATPGPWWDESGVIHAKHPILWRPDNKAAEHVCVVRSDREVEDGEFIAAAREGWPYAIRRALEAEAKIERLEAEIGILVEQINSNGRRGPWD